MVKVLIVLGNEGLEALVDLTEAEATFAANQLLDANVHIPELDLLSGLSLRMRYNSHREPQAYVVQLPMSIVDVRTELKTNKYFREMIAEKASKINL